MGSPGVPVLTEPVRSCCFQEFERCPSDPTLLPLATILWSWAFLSQASRSFQRGLHGQRRHKKCLCCNSLFSSFLQGLCQHGRGHCWSLGYFSSFQKSDGSGRSKICTGKLEKKEARQESFILFLLPLLVSLLSCSLGCCSWQGGGLRSGPWPAFLCMLVQGVLCVGFVTWVFDL